MQGAGSCTIIGAMTRVRSIRSAAVLAVAIFAWSRGPAQEPETSGGQDRRVGRHVSYFLELHSELLLAARGEPLTSGHQQFTAEIDAYAKARELAQSMRVWRLANDACAQSGTLDELRQLGLNLPGDLTAPDREAARKVFDALVSAWPRFEAGELPERKLGLDRTVKRTVGRYYTAEVEDRIMDSLYDRMGFAPVDRPIGVYFVVKTPFVGAWGETPKGYYVIVPSSGGNAPAVIDEMVHEVTHLIDTRQPRGSPSVLNRLRQRLARQDAELVDTFLHGLVAWNAGELVRRHLHELHAPVAETSPDYKNQLRPYLPVYRGIWRDFLDGKMGRDAVVEALASALEKAHP